MGFVLLVVVVLANWAYLYIVLFSTAGAKLRMMAEVGLGVFKALWNNVMIPLAVTVSQETWPDTREEEMITTYEWTVFFFYSVTNVVAPCLVCLLTDSLCLSNLFVSVESIVEEFSYDIASLKTCINTTVVRSLDSNDDLPFPPASQYCYSFTSPTTFVSDFEPPFTYSYQCGSAMIVNYVPVLIYSYAIQAVLVPLFLLWLYTLRLRIDAKEATTFTPSNSHRSKRHRTSTTDRTSRGSSFTDDEEEGEKDEDEDEEEGQGLGLGLGQGQGRQKGEIGARLEYVVTASRAKGGVPKGRSGARSDGRTDSENSLGRNLSEELVGLLSPHTRGLLRPLSATETHQQLIPSSSIVASIMQVSEWVRE